VETLKRFRWPIIGVGIAVVVVAFLAFRPDKLFVDDAVDESLADAFTTTTAQTAPPQTTTSTIAAPETTHVAEEGTTSTTAAPTTTTTATTPSAPVQVTTGAFYGIDHSAEGTAAVYEQDGTYVLRFEDDTDIQNGPDLYVWVLPSAGYDGGTPSDYLDLGKIKGNVGGQNYALPADFDPNEHRFVLVWCDRFSVPFAAAPLA
jgi:hypothetical protein